MSVSIILDQKYLDVSEAVRNKDSEKIQGAVCGLNTFLEGLNPQDVGDNEVRILNDIEGVIAAFAIANADLSVFPDGTGANGDFIQLFTGDEPSEKVRAFFVSALEYHEEHLPQFAA